MDRRLNFRQGCRDETANRLSVARALAIISLLTLGLCFGSTHGAAAASEAKPAPSAGKAAAKAGKTAKAKTAAVRKTSSRTTSRKAASPTKAASRTKAAARAGSRPKAKSAARTSPAKAAAARKVTSRKAATRSRSHSTVRKARATGSRSHGRAATARRAGAPGARAAAAPVRKPPLRTLIADHAEHYAVPEHLVRRIISKESKFNPNAKNGPNIGLMQIQLGTARGMGYRGDAKGLLDPDTNLRYGVAYLANAFRVAHGDEDDAVRLYQSGYYNEAKRKGLTRQLIAAR